MTKDRFKNFKVTPAYRGEGCVDFEIQNGDEQVKFRLEALDAALMVEHLKAAIREVRGERHGYRWCQADFFVPMMHEMRAAVQASIEADDGRLVIDARLVAQWYGQLVEEFGRIPPYPGEPPEGSTIKDSI